MLIQINYITTILQMDHHHVTTDQVKGKTPSSSCGNSDDKNKKMYRGVRKRKWGKWVSEIRLPNSRERIWLGSYDSPEKAARAFDAALYCLRGRHATFNFPDSPFHLDITAVSNNDPQQIREIAASFGNKNPPIIDNNNHNDGNINSDQSKTVTEIIGSSTSSSTAMHDSGNTIDWTFLDVLDGSSNDANFVGFENYGGFYSDLEKMHSGDLFSLPHQLPLFEDENQKEQIKVEGDDDVYDDPFSHQSFLWNWDF